MLDLCMLRLRLRETLWLLKRCCRQGDGQVGHADQIVIPVWRPSCVDNGGEQCVEVCGAHKATQEKRTNA